MRSIKFIRFFNNREIRPENRVKNFVAAQFFEGRDQFSFPKSFPGGSPNSSPKVKRTEGAVWTITIFFGSASAFSNLAVSSFSVMAAVGQTALHCPQKMQSSGIS